MHEIFPVRRPENQARPSRMAPYCIVMKVPQADHAKKAMKLIYGENSRGRVIDCGGQGLEPNIHQDAKGKCRVLLHCALGAEGDGGSQSPILDCGGTAIQHEERFSHPYKVTYVGYELDNPVRR